MNNARKSSTAFASALKAVSPMALSGLLRSRRRGTFLVLVVGTLAMLSIIMIVYVAVGNSDRRTSASLVRRNRSNEIIDIFADYLGEVVGDDVLASVADPSNGKSGVAGGDLYSRETWDAPRTDWFTDSKETDPTKSTYFRPFGSGDDPWLASTTPTWINYTPQATAPDPAKPDERKWPFTKRTDWLHITNIAPDGRFVNLVNLRDKIDAEPGASTNRMSDGLTLLDATNGSASRKTVWGDNISNTTLPSLFDSWQVGAFRPARGPFKLNGIEIPPNDPAYPPNQWADTDGDGWLDSRWFEMVDARGGNFVTPGTWKSLIPSDPNYRWIFAARIVDLSSLVNVNVATDLDANPNDETTLFSATGQNNVFDATSKWKAGTQVLGRSPAEVDLRRLLTMRDFREVILGKPATNGTPSPITAADKLAVLDVNPANPVQQITRDYTGGYSAIRQPTPRGAGPVSPQDYSKYGGLPNTGTSQIAAITLAGPNLTNDVNIGLGGYRALRAAIALGRPPGRFSDYSTPPLSVATRPMGQPQFRWDAFRYGGGPQDRPVYRSDPDPTASRPAAGFDFGLGFRSDALIELLTYRGANDPKVTSALEAALGGRAVSEFALTNQTINTPAITYSPLRENRDLELERENIADKDGKPTEAALLKAYTDVRQYLTTMSGARPLVPNLNAGVLPNPETPSSLSSSETSFELSENTTASTVFRGMATALMPGLPPGASRTTAGVANDLEKAWDDTTQEAKSLRGLYYGHQGPLSALLTSAHIAANFDSGAKLPGDADKGKPYVLVLQEDFQFNADGKLPTNLAAASGFESGKKNFPAWWTPSHQFNLARPEQGRATSLAMPRIPETGGTTVPVPAVNIYGTGDAHPFLVGVATFTVYRDVSPFPNRPSSQATDIEALYTPLPSRITINGQIAENNPDFLYRVFAVQVQNPFAVPIRLSSNFSGGPSFATAGPNVDANVGSDFFYIRVGTRAASSSFFVLGDVNEAVDGSGQLTGAYSIAPVVIQPGETIVFYALNQDRKSIVERRLNSTGITNPSGDLSGKYLENWLTNQIGPKSAQNFRRIQMLRVEDAAFESAIPTVSKGTFAFGNGSKGVLVPLAAANDDVIGLYRAIRIDSGASAGDAGSGVANVVTNDQLCDRMTLGTTAVLDRRLRGLDPTSIQPGLQMPGVTTESLTTLPGGLNGLQNRERTLAASGPAPFLNGSGIDYNSRLTVAIATYARRPNDPAGADLKIGMLPAWALDPKDASDWYSVEMVPDPAKLTNNLLNSTVLADAMAGDPWRGRFATFKSLDWELLPAIFPDLASPAGSSGAGFVGKPDKVTTNKAGQKFVDLRRELASNGRAYRGEKVNPADPDQFQARPVDLLGVLAVGPYEAPVASDGTTVQTDLYKRWTTTAEALAMAFGYSTKPTDANQWKAAGNKYGPLDYYYFDRFSTNPNPKPLFDGGYLRLDDYVSVRYDAAGTKAYTAGNGAPIAGNILTMFRTIPDRFAGLTAATPGLVNINTAPIPVLRVLPLASPAQDEASSSTNVTKKKPTLWPDLNNANDPEVAAQRTDIAAMIESYRDKIAVELRPGAKNPDPTKAAYATWFAPFIDRSADDPTTATRLAPNAPKLGDPGQSPIRGGRYWTSGLPGIREESGFRSLAELLALRVVKFDNTGTVTAGREYPSNFDFLGYQPLAAGSKGTNILGIDNVLELTADAAGKVTKAQPLQFQNTNQDRLKILAALGGSVSVRSDLYAAWFVVRGYQRSDVEGLADDQPMVPSIERRFLMIIDRSNVTKPGQKPRVVAMVELPL
ncbi:MAG: hypothetical protein K2Y21_03510 [Phycisphaerales bacterium]|nr:hypothetical protein [Phycisphaerales bacterium]